MKRTTTPGSVLAVAAALVGTGCSEGSSTPSGTVGEVGFGIFNYVCVSEGDAVCNQESIVDATVVRPDLGVDGQLPTAIAVAGRFDLRYYGDVPASAGGSALPVDIVPVAPSRVRSVGGFTFLEPGTVAFMVRNPQGIVSDFIHLTAAEVGALDLWWNEQRVSTVELRQPGDETTAAVVPVDDSQIALAGALGFSWSTSDPSVLRVAPLGSEGLPEPSAVVSDDEVRVVGMAEGEASLIVELGGLSSELTVSVGPEVTE